MRTNCKCGTHIPAERSELGYVTCLKCGERDAVAQKRSGYVSYGHKTAGTIVITTQRGFQNYKRVSSRMAKGSNMSYASRAGTQF